jgi:NADH:ubiquinone oxidoreductase subunit E
VRAYPAKTVALLLTIATGVATLVTAGWLTVDALAAHRRAAAHAARVETLRQDGQHDASLAAVLHEEYETETLAALARDERSRTLAWTLLTAAAAFLLSAGRLIAASSPAIPTKPGVVTLPVIQPVAAAPAAQPASDGIHLAPVDQIIAHTGTDRTAVIPILQAVQAHYRYLPAAALRHICQHTDITPAQLTGVATFYPQFRHTPVGEHVIKVCHGTACHVAGAARITDELRRGLGIAPDADTDAHRKYTLEPVACMGCCTLAPVLQVDGTTHGHLLSDTVLQTVLHATAAPNGRPPAPAAPHTTAGRPRAGEIRIGLGSCCVANGSGRVHEALSAALGRNGTQVSVKRVGCVGMCHHTPLVELDLADGRTISYARVTPELCAAIVRRHFPAANVFRRLRQACTATLDWLRRDPAAAQSNGRRIAPADPPVAAFLGPQVHIATEHCGNLDPTDLDEYLAHGGFAALRHCRQQLTPAETTALIARSGLRGRGGAGFPTGAKWAKVRAATRPAQVHRLQRRRRRPRRVHGPHVDGVLPLSHHRGRRHRGPRHRRHQGHLLHPPRIPPGR